MSRHTYDLSGCYVSGESCTDKDFSVDCGMWTAYNHNLVEYMSKVRTMIGPADRRIRNACWTEKGSQDLSIGFATVASNGVASFHRGVSPRRNGSQVERRRAKHRKRLHVPELVAGSLACEVHNRSNIQNLAQRRLMRGSGSAILGQPWI